MTAPFNPRHAGVRDPFSAYAMDEASLALVRQVAAEMGWPHERIHEGGLRAAAQGLALAPSPAVLLVDLSDAADPLTDIDALAEVCEPGTIVIACGAINDVGLYRALIQSGIHDYLAKPFALDELRGAILGAQAALLDPHGTPAEARPHLSVAVIGVRGGVGATTVAASLAWELGASASRSTALLDLDVHFGTGALQLDLEPGRGLTDAIENPGRIDGLFLERAMVRATPMLSVLSAEAPLAQPLPNDGTAYLQLQEELRQSFDATVIDLPRHLAVQHAGLLGDVGVAIVVTEYGLAATRDTIRTLAWLRSNAPRVAILVVANRVAPGGGEIAPKDFEASIERTVDLALPLDAKLSVQAAKLGKPLIEVAKGSKLGAALAELAPRALAASGEENDVAEAPKSLVGRLADLKSLLAKKPK